MSTEQKPALSIVTVKDIQELNKKDDAELVDAAQKILNELALTIEKARLATRAGEPHIPTPRTDCKDARVRAMVLSTLNKAGWITRVDERYGRIEIDFRMSM